VQSWRGLPRLGSVSRTLHSLFSWSIRATAPMACIHPRYIERRRCLRAPCRPSGARKHAWAFRRPTIRGWRAMAAPAVRPNGIVLSSPVRYVRHRVSIYIRCGAIRRCVVGQQPRCETAPCPPGSHPICLSVAHVDAAVGASNAVGLRMASVCFRDFCFPEGGEGVVGENCVAPLWC
jgi:hypothetical protein